MDNLDEKLNGAFPGYTVRKDLARQVRGNAAVPSYVLEFLLGQNCATDDEAQIAEGIERVREILAAHYVQRSEAGLVKSRIRETGYQRIIDKVSVSLNERRDAYEATFENLGVSKVLVDSSTVKSNQRLLVSGVWCIADLSYAANEAKDESPYILDKLKPIQLAWFDFDEYCEGRAKFTMDEWIDVLTRSLGFKADSMGRANKLLQLVRLIPYCERNYNLIELGPKGTGKSHVFSEFSPHGILISGGEVTPAKLFVNNSNGRIGLVGYWDCVAFDEFAGKNKRPKPDVVDIMKNYMANKSFSRGVEQITAEASMAFVGNTSHDLAYMIKTTDLLDDLPEIYHDPAFIDRIHAYIPGWEMDIIRGDMFSSDFGFIVDYLAEALRHLRTLDYSSLYQDAFELHPSISTRDRDGIRKTFSGLMKIIFPGKDATPEEMAELLEVAIELRERVKDTILRIDETFERVNFSYRPKGGDWKRVTTLEEGDFPSDYHALDKVPYEADQPCPREQPARKDPGPEPVQKSEGAAVEPSLFEGHRTFRENSRGVSYEKLFGPYFDGARSITIVDPYVRAFHQCRNLMEVLEVALRHFDYKVPALKVHLLTSPDEYSDSRQVDYLQRIAESMAPLGLDFTWDLDEAGTIHDRSISVDDTWYIMLGRGLDIWQKFDSNDAFAPESAMPEMRRVRAFEIAYMKAGE